MTHDPQDNDVSRAHDHEHEHGSDYAHDHDHGHEHPAPSTAHPARRAHSQSMQAHAYDAQHHDHSEHDHSEHDHDTHSHDDGEHDHGHGHDHDHEHGHDHGSGIWGWVNTIFHLHGHSHQQQALATDSAFLHNEEGIRTVWLALAALSATSVIQIVIVLISGSVALLADTIHNIGDGLNSIPLLIAFYLARRAANRRYSYGFARAEDVAGIFIVLSIAFSAGVIFWESIQKLIHPEPLSNLGWVAVAAIIGFLGNEAVALLQIRVGRRIGSAALVADGLHARTDGLTSLAVLLAVGGSWLGYPIVDPIIGILIGIAILFITRDATITMWYRLMDAIEPEWMERAEAVLQHYVEEHHEVKEMGRLRMRWMGHRIHAEVHIAVEPELSTAEGHRVVEEIRHDLFHALPYLSEAVVHVDPWSPNLAEVHQETLHHEQVPSPAL